MPQNFAGAKIAPAWAVAHVLVTSEGVSVRVILKSPRVLRTGQPLGLEAIRQVCPSAFATNPHPDRSKRYSFISSYDPIVALMDNGWGIYEASSQRARSIDRDSYGKHMLRMRKLTDFDSRPGSEGVPEVILINSHDGGSRYTLGAGYFRFVCSNGLIAGNVLAHISVTHTLSKNTAEQVLGAAEKVVTEKFPVLLNHIEQFKSIKLDTTQKYRLADKALKLRYGDGLPPYTNIDVLTPRRVEDEGDDLWSVLNRTQENVMYGGFETRSLFSARRSSAKPVERVSAVAKINGGIWDEAFEIAKECTGV